MSKCAPLIPNIHNVQIQYRGSVQLFLKWRGRARRGFCNIQTVVEAAVAAVNKAVSAAFVATANQI